MSRDISYTVEEGSPTSDFLRAKASHSQAQTPAPDSGSDLRFLFPNYYYYQSLWTRHPSPRSAPPASSSESHSPEEHIPTPAPEEPSKEHVSAEVSSEPPTFSQPSESTDDYLYEKELRSSQESNPPPSSESEGESENGLSGVADAANGFGAATLSAFLGGLSNAGKKFSDFKFTPVRPSTPSIGAQYHPTPYQYKASTPFSIPILNNPSKS